MSQTNILLEAGTNELEIVEFYIDEPVTELDSGTSSALKLIQEEGKEPIYRGYYGVNVAKVLEIVFATVQIVIDIIYMGVIISKAGC